MWADTQKPEDIDLAKRAVEAACEHIEQFDMNTWMCGSIMCIGGWMCWLSNQYNPPKDRDDVLDWINSRGYLKNEGFFNLLIPSMWSGFSTRLKPRAAFPKINAEQLKSRFAYWLETGR